MLLGLIRKIAGDVRGATAVEYGLIVAIIVIGIISALMGLASATTGIWNNISDKVQNAH